MFAGLMTALAEDPVEGGRNPDPCPLSLPHLYTLQLLLFIRSRLELHAF